MSVNVQETQADGSDIEERRPATPEGTMRAIVQSEYGTADVLRLAEAEIPSPTANQVLVRVRAAGLDRGAWHVMTGKPYAVRLFFGIRKPKNHGTGQEVAGTVVAIGSAVTRFAVGDAVFGIARGAFAEYAVASEDKLAMKPHDLTFEYAAVVAVSALTALQAIRDVGRVQSGQQVLIVGASGGVGSYAVQLAKAFGAEVTGVCSTAKLELVRSLGADHVIDYTRDDFGAGRLRYDLILDIAGNSAISRLRRALTPTGTVVMVGGEEGGRLTGGIGRQLRGRVVSMFSHQRLTGLLCKERFSDLECLAELIAAGDVTPSVGKTYPLDEVPRAMRDLERGSVRGKVAIAV